MNNHYKYKNAFKILKGGKISLVVSAMIASTTLTFASPTGGTVTSGNATISQSGSVTNINQSTNKASINWNKFNIASNETVNFNQPNSSSITLNRVIGNETSVINGALNANGQVWILNSNGVLFGKNASINTSGLLATTKNLSDENFQAGNYSFSGDSTGSVINTGTINIKNSGYVVFASNEVQNSGTIKAISGEVHLVGADEYTINLNGNSLINLTVDKGVLDALVENSGTIIADGGSIYLTTNAVDELLKGVVNNTGVLEANSLDDVTGTIELFANGGEVQVGGTLDASNGFIETSGKDFTILDDASISAGEWLIDPVDITIDDTLAGTIETALGNGDVTIETDTPNYSDVDTSSNESGTTGNITVNSDITWSSGNRLTLDAIANIYINSIIDGTTNNGKLALYYGDNSDYYINGKVNLNAGQNFFTKQTSDTSETAWTVVNTATDLQNISLSGNTVLGSDLDLSSINNWIPITSFSGKLDGLGHIVNNLTIDGSQVYVGLFGQINGATISNIGLSNTNITNRLGNYDAYIGGLIGLSDNSEIINSYVDGDLIIDNSTMTNHYISIGGLIGLNRNSPIKYSYTNVDMTLSLYSVPTYYIGNLIGYNYNSSINDSYSKGSINQLYTVYSNKAVLGGFIGNNSGGDLTNTYSNVDVNTYHISLLGGFIGLNDGTIVDSFYDKETSGLSTSIGTDTSTTSSVTGLTTAQMSYGQIYKDAGWDIVADSSVTSSTPVLKYDSVNDKYVWVIAPLALNYNLGSKSTTYDGTTQSLSDFYTTSSIFGSDYDFLGLTSSDYSYQVNGSDVTNYTNAGTYSNIKVILNTTSDFLTMASSGNTDGTLTINPKAITVVADDKIKTYGDTNPSFTYSLAIGSSLVSGDTLSSLVSGSLSTTATTTSDAGNYSISGLSDVANDNYTVSLTDGTLTITPKAVTVVADNKTKVYGDSNPTFTYTVTGLIGTDTLSGDLSTTATQYSDVDDYDITNSLSNSNYDITYTKGTLTITPKVIIVVANNNEINLGDNPNLTYSLSANSSLIGNDTLNGTLSTNPQNISSTGIYDIVQGTLNNSNYDINFIDGVLTVNSLTTPNNQNLVNKIIAPIQNHAAVINQTVINNNITNPIKPTTQFEIPQSNGSIVTAVQINENTRMVTLSQLKEDNQGNSVRVPLNNSSSVILIDSGVNLPQGIDQEFYVAAEQK